MRLLLDECAGDRYLKDALIAAGHDVIRSVDALGGGVDVVTFNNADFIGLAHGQSAHPGMLLIYLDNRPTDMAVRDIVKAISNVEAVHAEGVGGNIIVLNQYRW